MRQIKKIIIHQSASDIPTHDDISVVDRWHKERGWKGVGYHYFIQSDGVLQYGRSICEVGAHTKGHNRDSIGICLHGKTKFTPNQFATLRHLVESLDFTLGNLKVYGHSDFEPTRHCPGFDYKNVLK
jgi:N-acetylmuramoyl-L-alanine amidase